VLTTAFARVAFAGDYGGTWFLTQLVGSGKAKELYYFSERLSAENAKRLGIVNAIFPSADFEREVMARARRLAEGLASSGHDREQIERQLASWHFHPAVAFQAAGEASRGGSAQPGSSSWPAGVRPQ